MTHRSATLRFVLFQLLLTTVAALLVFSFLAWRTERLADSDVRGQIAEELALVKERFDAGGFAAAKTAVAEIEAASRGDRALTRLEDENNRQVAGNLAAWPPVIRAPSMWQRLPLYIAGASRERLFGVSTLLLGKGRLLIGRELSERQAVLDTLYESLALGLILMVAAGIVGGLIHARYTLGQLDSIADSARAIMSSDPGGRIANSGRQDEFDRLGAILNELLDQQERQRHEGELIATSLAHDIRTPLARIRQVIDIGRHDQPTALPILNAVDEEIVRLLRLIKALLETARARAGIGSESFETLDFTDIVAEIVDLYAPVAADAHMPIVADIGPRLYVRGSRQLLSQAIVNLIENALRHASGSGGLVIKAQQHGETISFSLADHGPGIPESDRERVQKAFVRLDPSRSGEGSGLGLAFVAGVTSLHHGHLTLDDNFPGLVARLMFPAAIIYFT